MFKNFYNNLGLQIKINAIAILISLIGLAVLSASSYVLTRHYMIDYVIRNNYENLRLIGNKFDLMFDNVEIATGIAVTDDQIQSLFSDAMDASQRFRASKSLNAILKSMIQPWTAANRLVIYDNQGFQFNSGELVPSPSTLLDGDSQPVHAMTQWVLDDTHVHELIFRRKFNNSNTGAPLGIIDAVIEEEALSSIYTDPALGTTGTIYVCDTHKTILSSAHKPVIGTTLRGPAGLYSAPEKGDAHGAIVTHGSNKYIVTRYRYERFNWLIYAVVPFHQVDQDLNVITFGFILLWIGCIFLTALLSRLLTKSITTPIKTLTDAVTSIGGGNLAARAPVTGTDEIGLLSHEFNNMASEITLLLDRISSEKAEKQALEMAMLQAQINPHFLYNTIDNICGLAMMNRNDDIVSVMKSLSKFYRGVLGEGSVIITVAQEVTITEHYLKIMKVRYGDKFNYTIHIPPECANHPIPKMSLQPIVENAIYHGIRAKDGVGAITITATPSGQGLTIAIDDDGIGMDDERVRQILTPKAQQADTSFGLKSTHHRLQLYFGDAYGLTIKSRPKKGTRVTLHLPKPG